MTEEGFKRCRIAMYVEDKDKDWFLNTEEYTKFLDRVSEYHLHKLQESYDDLPEILQTNFMEHDFSGWGIFVSGAFPIEEENEISSSSSTSELVEAIRNVCIDTYKAIDDTHKNSNDDDNTSNNKSNIFSRSDNNGNNYDNNSNNNNNLRGNYDLTTSSSSLIVSSSQCSQYLKESDKNENNQLDANEYPYFLTYISSDLSYMDQPFHSLQERLQTNFNHLKYNDNDQNNNGSIDISDIYDKDDATTNIKTEQPQQTKFIDWICQQTMDAIQDATPTASSTTADDLRTNDVLTTKAENIILNDLDTNNMGNHNASAVTTTNTTNSSNSSSPKPDIIVTPKTTTLKKKIATNERTTNDNTEEEDDDSDGMKSKVIKFLVFLLFVGIGAGAYFYVTTNEDGKIKFARIKKKVMGFIMVGGALA